MNDFISVINYYFVVLRQVFNLLISNWFFGFIFLVLIFAFLVSLVGAVRGQK